MRWKLLYAAGLCVAAAGVFSATYFFGRQSSLEAELERLTAPRPAPAPARQRGIPSLEQLEPPAEKPAEPQTPAGEPLGEGIVAFRSPLEPGGLAVVADLPALASPAGGGGGAFSAGLLSFLAGAPAGLLVGARSLAATAGGCGPVDAIAAPGSSVREAVAAALAGAAAGQLSQRDPAAAIDAAARDLEAVPGERAIVLLAGGPAGCPGDFCGAAPPPAGGAQRVHVLLLAPPPREGEQPGGSAPPAGGPGASPPVFEPDWEPQYRCLAERSGGTIAVVATAEELERALRRIAGGLEAAVVVKALHYTGEEVKGISPGGDAAWGATLSLGGAAKSAGPPREAPLFPASFAVPAGVHVIKAAYAGQERNAAVSVARGERVEVRFTFMTGELFVEARDAAGREIVGDSAGFSCAWGVEVFAGNGGEARPVASTCTFPARIELGPGTYRVRARWKGVERIIEEASVEAGANSVHSVSFASE